MNVFTVASREQVLVRRLLQQTCTYRPPYHLAYSINACLRASHEQPGIAILSHDPAHRRVTSGLKSTPAAIAPPGRQSQ